MGPMIMGLLRAPGVGRVHGPGLGTTGRICLALLLGAGSLFSASCDHRDATARSLPKKARLPKLRVPDNPPLDEPAPLGFSLASKPAEAVLTTETEITCDKDAPSGMVCIPGGPFWRGNDTGKPDEKPRQRVVVSPFYMDTYEVDNQQYFKCVEAGHCDPPIKYYPMFAKPKQPVVAVSWYEANDYCKFAGKRLPTEAEWEKAARGPDGEVFPWGNEPPTCKLANYEEPLGAKGCGSGITSLVGSRPAYRYGLYDMAGNSWEWVDDWKSDCYQGCKQECGAECQGPDPHGPCGGGAKHCPGHSEKLLKGGSWYFTGDRMRGAERRGVPPSNRGPHRLGFRCAKSVH